MVVSNEIQLVLDVEAILLDDLQQTGAIEYYRNQAKELNPRRLWRRLVQIGAGVVVVAVAVVVLTGWGQHGASSVMRTNRGGYRLPWSPTAHQGTRRCRTRACRKKTNP